MTTDRFLDVWTDTISQPKPCADPVCGRSIVFAELVKSGKRHPFVADYEAAPGMDWLAAVDGPDRSVTRINQRSSHFADCPGAKKFSRRA